MKPGIFLSEVAAFFPFISAIVLGDVRTNAEVESSFRRVKAAKQFGKKETVAEFCGRLYMERKTQLSRLVSN